MTHEYENDSKLATRIYSKFEFGWSGRKTCARDRYFDEKLFNN